MHGDNEFPDEEFEEWFESLGLGRRTVMVDRIKKRFEEKYDEEISSLDENEDQVVPIFLEVAKEMYVQSILDSLETKGLVKANEVSESGEIGYVLTELGKSECSADSR